MTKFDTAKAYMDASFEWISSIDRSGLGSFAIDAGVLSIYDALDTVRGAFLFRDPEGKVISTDIGIALADYCMNNNLTEYLRDDIDHVKAEFLVWRKRTRHYWIGNMKPDSAAVDDRMKFLAEVLSITGKNPAAVGYVDVGIMDGEAIESFIADGIDPNMALILMADRLSA